MPKPKGRPKGTGERKPRMNFTLSDEAQQALDALAKRHTGGNRSAMLERLIMEARKRDGNDNP